jgi:hypothetical protein
MDGSVSSIATAAPVMPHPLDGDPEEKRLQGRIAPEPAHGAGEHREHVLHDVLGGRRI